MRLLLEQKDKTKSNASKKPSTVIARIFNNGLINETSGSRK
tara:strand:+ start:19543 stop:19665 length:123 start_codon:yes stop_codon:yes gene_type:complete